MHGSLCVNSASLPQQPLATDAVVFLPLLLVLQAAVLEAESLFAATPAVLRTQASAVAATHQKWRKVEAYRGGIQQGHDFGKTLLAPVQSRGATELLDLP